MDEQRTVIYIRMTNVYFYIFIQSSIKCTKSNTYYKKCLKNSKATYLILKAHKVKWVSTFKLTTKLLYDAKKNINKF